jgi:hypothetical protein
MEAKKMSLLVTSGNSVNSGTSVFSKTVTWLIQAAGLLLQAFPRGTLSPSKQTSLNSSDLTQSGASFFSFWPEMYSTNGKSGDSERTKYSLLQRWFETLTSDLNLKLAFDIMSVSFTETKLVTDVTNCLDSIFFLLGHTAK